MLGHHRQVFGEGEHALLRIEARAYGVGYSAELATDVEREAVRRSGILRRGCAFGLVGLSPAVALLGIALRHSRSHCTCSINATVSVLGIHDWGLQMAKRTSASTRWSPADAGVTGICTRGRFIGEAGRVFLPEPGLGEGHRFGCAELDRERKNLGSDATPPALRPRAASDRAARFRGRPR